MYRNIILIELSKTQTLKEQYRIEFIDPMINIGLTEDFDYKYFY